MTPITKSYIITLGKVKSLVLDDKLAGHNKCFPSFFFFTLNYLYRLYPFTLKYKPVIYNYVNTLGFILLLHNLLNKLYLLCIITL